MLDVELGFRDDPATPLEERQRFKLDGQTANLQEFALGPTGRVGDGQAREREASGKEIGVVAIDREMGA